MGSAARFWDNFFSAFKFSEPGAMFMYLILLMEIGHNLQNLLRVMNLLITHLVFQ